MITFNRKLILETILKNSKQSNLKNIKKIFTYIESKPILSSCSPFLIEKTFLNYRKKKINLIYIIYYILNFLKKFTLFILKTIKNKPPKNFNFEKILFFFF